MPKLEEIIENLNIIKERVQQACIKAGNFEGKIKIVAVTKTFPVEVVSQVLSYGINDIGENRIQEALPKIEKIKKEGYEKVSWHLLGHLQTNKVKKAVDSFNLIHSVDSLKLCEKISNYAIANQIIQEILLEVNIAGEESKFGFNAKYLKDIFYELKNLKGIRILGLMIIAPICNNSEEVRFVFRELRELRDYLQITYSVVLPELSMGMSDDFEVAIEEGATIIRLGRAIFGSR